MIIAFFDTETTGLWKDAKGAFAPEQPLPLQVGLKLNIDRKNLIKANFLVKIPTTYTVDPKAQEVHGKSMDVVQKYGTHIITACEYFLDTMQNADIMVAHNAIFDINVMRNLFHHYYKLIGEPYVDHFADRTIICTMLSTKNIVKATPKRRNGEWKYPSLMETYKHFFHEGFDGAHDALADVEACERIFYHLMDQGIFN